MKPLRALAPILLPVILAACGLNTSPTGPIAVPTNPTPGPVGPEGSLLVRLDTGYATDNPGQGRLLADYLADGTVIRWTSGGATCEPGTPCGSLERNTLTADGLAALRAELAKDAGLLGAPTTYKSTLLPGKAASARPGLVDTFTLPKADGTRYTVVIPSAASPDAADQAPDVAIERLQTLAAALVDPATLTGATGLAKAGWDAYTPAKTAVFVVFHEIAAPIDATGTTDPNGVLVGPLDGGPSYPDIKDTGWPFAGAPDTFGEAFTPAGSATGTGYRCAFLPSADALAGIGRLPASIGTGLIAGDQTIGRPWLSSVLRWSAKSPTTGLSLVAVPILPENAAASCADLLPG